MRDIIHYKTIYVNETPFKFEAKCYLRNDGGRGGCYGLCDDNIKKWQRTFPNETEEEWLEFSDKFEKECPQFEQMTDVVFRDDLSENEKVALIESIWGKFKNKRIKIIK